MGKRTGKVCGFKEGEDENLTIIVDSNGLAHREAHKLSNLSYEERKTGVLFGFLREVLKLHRTYETSKFIFCWDSPLSSSKRKEEYPKYKENRKGSKLEAEIYEQFDLLRTEILPDIGFRNIFVAEGYESDDLIAELVHSNKRNFIIATSDNDLYQLLVDGCVWIYSLHTKKEYTEADFHTEFNTTVDIWYKIKAVSGCKTDNVEGVLGVGTITAIKYFNGTLSPNTEAFKRIGNNQELIKRNDRLVKLPYPGTPHLRIRRDNLSIDNFIKVCNIFGFNSFLQKENFSKWKNFLMS